MTRKSDLVDGFELGGGTLNRKTREVYLIGPVDGDTARTVVPAIRELDRKPGPIHLIIMSPGGSEGIGWAIYDTLQMTTNQVIGHAVGECQSIAALILQGCHLRLMTKNCRFMVHNGSVTLDVTVTQMRSYGEEIMHLTDRYYEALAERSGMSLKKVRKLCDRETFLSAEQCLELGFVDGILTKPPVRKRSR